MRLFLNPKEVDLIRDCLVYQSQFSKGETKQIILRLLERIELCDQRKIQISDTGLRAGSPGNLVYCQVAR